ncbi:MAG: hypothetical protein KC620_14630, partial [Myxococcales bacterium]|nr:hypothetical protein [Myxococcales bacterium]
MIRAARLGWVAALLASLACADPVVDEDAGAAADVPPLPPAADQGGRPLDRGLVVDAAPPRADGAMVPVDVGGCIAGLCTVCGPDGRERATDDDDRCAAADCSVYEA